MKAKQEKVEIDLLFKENLKEFLSRLEIYEKFINGEIKCDNCNKILTFDNLGVIKFKNRKFLFICNETKCMKEI